MVRVDGFSFVQLQQRSTQEASHSDEFVIRLLLVVLQHVPFSWAREWLLLRVQLQALRRAVTLC
jgi:hypothetical protein